MIKFKKYNLDELKNVAKKIRVLIINMLAEAGSGHPGGSLGSVEILTALYFKIMKHDPKNPSWEDRDRFILSNGHVCPVLYAALSLAGYINEDELYSLRKINSRLQGHQHLGSIPGLENTGGSLGQGLSFAVGISLGAKLDNAKYKIYCEISDGECQEGQTWEAAMAAAHYNLDNLCVIVDYNGIQIDGYTKDVMDLKDLASKWKSFGWYVSEVNGHNLHEIIAALNASKENKSKPTAILAKTILGKGVSYMENNPDWHGKAPSKNEAKIALKELE